VFWRLVELPEPSAKLDSQWSEHHHRLRVPISANPTPARDVSAITNAPEMLGGRVKTLHPAVHGGILAQDTESDAKDLEEQKIGKVDYVVCNLYPFKETVAKTGVSIDEGWLILSG